MNMINKNRVQNYINLIERCYVGFSPMIACLFEAGIPEYEIFNEISAVVYSFCTVAFYNIFKENMPADSEGQSEHIKGITNMILEYYKTINNYCHEKSYTVISCQNVQESFTLLKKEQQISVR